MSESTSKINFGKGMLGIYFSGTGNSRYALEYFLKQFDDSAEIVSIEDDDIIASKIKEHTEIVFSYPVQYSNMPKMVKDFTYLNANLWQGKKVFIIATMSMFSGDGAGLLGRRLHRYGAQIIGGLHLKMPDSISDIWLLKRSLKKNRKIVRKAEQKIEKAALDIKNGKMPNDGMGCLEQMAGLLGQRLFLSGKTTQYYNRLKIKTQYCTGCGKCAEACPMQNIKMWYNVARAKNRCTMCYRCVNICPEQLISVLGWRVYKQGTIENYLPDNNERHT